MLAHQAHRQVQFWQLRGIWSAIIHNNDLKEPGRASNRSSAASVLNKREAAPIRRDHDAPVEVAAML